MVTIRGHRVQLMVELTYNVLLLLIDIPRSVQNYSMSNNIYLLISLPKLIMVGVTLWGLLSLLFEMDASHMF